MPRRLLPDSPDRSNHRLAAWASRAALLLALAAALLGAWTLLD